MEYSRYIYTFPYFLYQIVANSGWAACTKTRRAEGWNIQLNKRDPGIRIADTGIFPVSARRRGSDGRLLGLHPYVGQRLGGEDARHDDLHHVAGEIGDHTGHQDAPRAQTLAHVDVQHDRHIGQAHQIQHGEARKARRDDALDGAAAAGRLSNDPRRGDQAKPQVG